MRCRDCGTTDESLFARDKSRCDGMNRLCKGCDGARRTARRRATRGRLINLLNALLERGCQRCGEQSPLALDVMVSHKSYPAVTIRAKSVLREINGSCNILCANCRRKLDARVFLIEDVPKLTLEGFENPMAGMTIAEVFAKKFRNKFGKPLEIGDYAALNPLDVRIGGALTIDVLETKDLFFTVVEIIRAIEEINGKEFPFTDYSLVAMPSSDDHRADDTGRVKRILRVFPVEQADKFLKFNCVLLKQTYRADWNQAASDNLYVHDFVETLGVTYPVLNSPLGEFDDFETGAKYVRRFRGFAGWEKPHVVTNIILKDVDGNGRVDEDEIVKGNSVKFWDYEGVTNPNDLVYVEMDTDGIFSILMGSEVPQELIVRI